MSLPCLRQVGAGVEVSLYVQPRASRNKIVALQGDELKIALTAPPVDGAANKACRDFFARLCGVSKSSVTLASGETSRHKRLLVAGVDMTRLKAVIAAQLGA